MRTPFLTLILSAAAAVASAQTPATVAPETLRISVDDAVKMALDRNVDLAAARIDPEISDTRVAAAAGAFRPTFNTGLQRNNQLQPPASLLFPTATRTDIVTSNVGLSQQLPWFGTSYNVTWNAAHTNSDSFLNSYNPILQSGLSLSVSQPLVRGLAIDDARKQVETSRIDRDIAGTTLRETVVRTTAAVKSAYWNLVSARSNVDARRSVLASAEELVRVDTVKVEVGQSPPLDLVAAQAEVAADREQLIIAETTVKSVEDQLRALIFDTSDRHVWDVAIETVDSPPLDAASPDLNAAVTNALGGRADLARARHEIASARLDVKFSGNQRLPDVRANANYTASGLGGTQILRTGGFPGTIVGPGAATAFGSVLGQVFGSDYPTWTVGVSVNYPLGQAVEEAAYARTKLAQRQAEERLKSAESRAVQQVRDAWRKIEMNAKRIETARAARELAEQRLDAERKRFDVGMSTSFLVIQAQRDLAQARTSELAAILAYDLALVDFDAVQQASPEAS
ncbi:MAG: TolC family protein [Acidobacteriia bacterium]|nr:TolC family protein [Terriglobia bacterium]